MDSSNLSFITFDNQKVPEFKEVRGKDWIYWGEENNYPDYLIELYMRSSTHNAIVTGKTNYIIGGGWKAEKTALTIEGEAKINKFLHSINEDESLNELSEAVVLDFEMFNAVAIQIIFNRAGTDFTLQHIPFNKIRTNSDESKYYFSKDWTSQQQTKEKTGLEEFKKFDFEKSDKKGTYIYVYRITAPRKGKDPNVYPMPEYIGSTQAIETDVECSNYNLSEIKTGFSAGTILNFYNGKPLPEEKDAIEKQIKKKFSGTDRAGSIILNFAESRDKGSEAVPLTGNDLDKRYIELKKDVRQEIFTGHKVSSPMLFGVKTEGQLGGRSEIAEAYELFQNTYISRRQMILEKIFNKFLKLKGTAGKIELVPTEAINNNVFTENTIVANLPKKALQEIIAERMGIDLSKYENTTITSTQVMQMAKVESVLDGFKKIGRSKDLFSVIKKKEIEHANYFIVNRSHKLAVENFANALTANERAVIDLLGKDEKMPPSEIAKALKLSEEEIIVLIAALVAAGFLSSIKTGYKPTALGIATILEEGAKTANYEILYSYELRHNAPALVAGGESREFCKNLVEENKLYTRDEIDGLSNGMELDVWEFKGGWYTNPKTDAPTPQCRHIWVQNIVKLK